jgi:hypothetical protein
MKAWLKWGLILIGIVLLVLVIYLLISSIAYSSKESKISKLGVGMSLEEFENVLGKPVYGGKYCRVISSEKIKEYIEEANEQVKGCGLTEGGKCTLNDIPIYRNNKEKIQCLEMFPDEESFTYCGYDGNPKPIISEDTFRLYYNEDNIVCAIDRYGLGL